MNNKYLFIIIFLLIIFPPNLNNIRLNVKIIIALIGIIIICRVNEGFSNIDAEALQNMASLYNSSTGVLKVNNLEASGYISTNLVKPTDKTKGLNILGPNDQSLYFTEGQWKYIDLINTNVHIAGNRKPIIDGQEPERYSFITSVPTEFKETITANDIKLWKIDGLPDKEQIKILDPKTNSNKTKYIDLYQNVIVKDKIKTNNIEYYIDKNSFNIKMTPKKRIEVLPDPNNSVDLYKSSLHIVDNGLDVKRKQRVH